MPDIWGNGKLFTFSGLDGPTSWAHTLVCAASDHPLAIWLRLEPAAKLTLGEPPRGSSGMILGDAVDAVIETTGGSGRLRMAFADCFTLVGELTASLFCEMSGETHTEQGFIGFATEARDDAIRWCVALSPHSEADAQRRAEHGLDADLDALIVRRSAFVRGLDTSGLSDADERTYRKCAEVLKLNVRAPEGQIRRRWTTPDVWPHRHMWLWDSAFHAVGWRDLDGETAQDAILAVIEQQEPDGKIHLCDAPEPLDQPHTQPPVLAWAAWRVFETTGDEQFLRDCYEPLSRFIDWLFRERDANGNGLLEWHKQFENTRCRCGESGWDNSPRFDREIIDDHVDINAYVVQELQMLARMADVLGESDGWSERADDLAALVNERLWHDEMGLYFDRGPGDDPNGWMTMKSAACFLPIVAGIPSDEQARRMVEDHLTDPDQFWPATPVPTVALDEPQYSDDMWRGPAWMNINYLMWEGLHHYGFKDVADELRVRSLRTIEHWYEEAGGVFEYYDAEREMPPPWMHRKGGVGGRGATGFGVIRDYGWTAAMYVAWANRTEP